MAQIFEIFGLEIETLVGFGQISTNFPTIKVKISSKNILKIALFKHVIDEINIGQIRNV